MRKTVIAAAFLMSGSGVAVVGALNNVPLKGSDTLEFITKDVLAMCPNATSNGISYAGGGSTTGGDAMKASSPTQNVSPQSRALSQSEGCSTVGGAIVNAGSQAEGLVIALDGLSIAGATSTTATACGGRLAYTTAKSFTVTDVDGDGTIECGTASCPGNVYTINGWKDPLALIYGGKHNDNSKNCDSDARRVLVKTWANLFQDACSGTPCTGGLRRAFRRADLSGTTDTFVSLVGLGSIPPSMGGPKVIDFCNAFGAGAINGGDSDVLDNDPIRITCDANEQACAKDGTLGLVTVMDVPSLQPDGPDADTAPDPFLPSELYYHDAGGNPKACDSGKFRLMRPFSGLVPTGFLCPNGKATLFAKCFAPVKILAVGPPEDKDAACIAPDFPVQGFAANGIAHGGVYNRILKNKDGNYLTNAAGITLTATNHLMHATKVIAAGAAVCRKLSATDQIGCLTQAHDCTLGFAGREGLSVEPGITGLTINNVAPTQANIEALVLGGTAYPLARKLYFNTIKGFMHADLATGEFELAKCMANNGIVSPIATARGFVAVPGAGVFCEDFDETRAVASGGCAAATNVNACSDNAL